VVSVMNFRGERRALAEGWSTNQGLAWAADGREVWFTAAREGAGRRIHAVTLDGAVREILHVPGSIMLLDISPPGDVLFVQGTERIGMKGKPAEEGMERDLSWLDWSHIRDLSGDGQWILFDETGEGGGANHGVFMRKMDGSPAVRLADGVAMRFSPDRKTVSTLYTPKRDSIALVPTGAGISRRVSTGGVECLGGVWHPDGRSLLVGGARPGEAIRIHQLNLVDESIAAVTPEGYGQLDITVSPEGSRLAVMGPDHTYVLVPLEGGEIRPIPGIRPLDRPIRWSPDGRAILVAPRGEIPARIDRIDLETGERTRWMELAPADATGLLGLAPIRLADDLQTCAYSYQMLLHDLYLASGLS
jgi:Tol biopolymer transport system component